jgi:hypothetical protein
MEMSRSGSERALGCRAAQKGNPYLLVEIVELKGLQSGLFSVPREF